MIGFTLIDGVLSTYDIPDSLTFGFYGLNNAGQVVGFYQDANEVSHGVIVQAGELTQFDFPGAAETEIFGVSESGLLIGDIFDADGAIHGFVGSETFDVPGAVTTYADDMNAAGILVGSYVDADGVYHGYIRHADGSFTIFDYPGLLSNLEYLFVNAINDAGVIVFRAKALDSLERTYIRLPNGTSKELKFPGSVTTVARDITRDGQIVGYYDTLDERRHGFIATPLTSEAVEDFSSVYQVSLTKRLNMVSVPLKPKTPMTARSFAEMVGATTVIALDEARQKFVGWTPDAPGDGFWIEGGNGYIVNLLQSQQVTFTGTAWTNRLHSAAAPSVIPNEETWAFVVSGRLESDRNLNGYIVTARNLRTNAIMKGNVRDGYFAVATADLTRRSVVQIGDSLEVTVTDRTGEIASAQFSFTVTPDALLNAVLPVMLDGVGTPKQTLLLQNYPNPFNPETWIPYHLSEAAPVTLAIYDPTGQRIRTLLLGLQAAGFYQSRSRAAYWDGRNDLGEQVSSGVYFYQLSTPSEHQIKRMVIVK
ncbi:T9SS type A sorting domain-containing protein [Candidatus Poribacteria bacterium]|nr:T9SS type A sorting domain-containing protein [Candidatus Poribacteria bacterium]